MIYENSFKISGNGFICPKCGTNDIKVKVGFITTLLTCNKCGYQERF